MRHEADVDALYRERGEHLLRYLIRRTGDPEIAADLWAETFAQAVKSRGRFRGSNGDAVLWLYTIARRQLARYYRRGKAERRAMKRLGMERHLMSAEVEVELVKEAGLAEMREAIAIGVELLSESEREAVMLRVVEEMSYADMASRLAISENAARLRVSRGMATLGRVLDAQMLREARGG